MHQFMAVACELYYFDDAFGHLPYPIWRTRTSDSSIRHEGAGDYSKNGDGEPLYSWRLELLPYMEISSQHKWVPAESWNSPSNRDLVQMSFAFSYDESRRSRKPVETGVQTFPETTVLAITGPGTAFGAGQEPPKSLKEIPGNTILVVESRTSGIPWPSPGDFDLRTMPQTINAPDGKGISSRYPEGFNVIFADTQVWFLSHDVPFENLKKFFTIEDAKKYDRERLLGPFALGQSKGRRR